MSLKEHRTAWGPKRSSSIVIASLNFLSWLFTASSEEEAASSFLETASRKWKGTYCNDKLSFLVQWQKTAHWCCKYACFIYVLVQGIRMTSLPTWNNHSITTSQQTSCVTHLFVMITISMCFRLFCVDVNLCIVIILVTPESGRKPLMLVSWETGQAFTDTEQPFRKTSTTLARHQSPSSHFINTMEPWKKWTNKRALHSSVQN